MPGPAVIHNHGYRTVDPLKHYLVYLWGEEGHLITTVIGPWTH